MENQVSSRHKKSFRYRILERPCVLEYYSILENARERLLLAVLDKFFIKGRGSCSFWNVAGEVSLIALVMQAVEIPRKEFDE
jgi:hypothetical protein